MASAIGILDLQGDVIEHIAHFESIGVSTRRVKAPADLSGLSGLVIPGGESTCLWRLLRLFELDRAIADAVGQQKIKVWGTCAGAILLATRIRNEPAKLGLLDIEVARNAFGSQLDSFHSRALIPKISDREVPLTFIRAPKILQAGKDVEVLLAVDDYIAMVESTAALATIFHPEMTPCLAFHRYFARKCGVQRSGTDRV